MSVVRTIIKLSYWQIVFLVVVVANIFAAIAFMFWSKLGTPTVVTALTILFASLCAIAFVLLWLSGSKR